MTHLDCPKCNACEAVEVDLDLDSAMTERDGDHLTFYYEGECGVCEETSSVVEYATMHTLEVE